MKRKRILRAAFITMIFVGIFGGCLLPQQKTGNSQNQNATTGQETENLRKEWDRLTGAPKPVLTKKPTATPKPTKAPTPTATPKPTATPEPTPVPVVVPEDYLWKNAYGRTTVVGFLVPEDLRYQNSYLKEAGDTTGFLAICMDTEDEVCRKILEGVSAGTGKGRPEMFALKMTWENAEQLVKRVVELPGVYSAVLEERVRYKNGSMFWISVFSDPVLYAWEAKDTEKLSTEESQVYEEAKKLVAQAQKYTTEYEKEVFFHDYLVDTIVFDEIDRGGTGQMCYGALVLKRCVCAGYTNAFRLLLNMCGIDALYVEGTAGDDNHAWNKAKIDGQWYNVDVTWDDPTPDQPHVVYTYLNVTDEYLAETHEWVRGVLPVCNSTKLNYCKKEMKSCADRTAITSYGKQQLKQGNKVFYVEYNGAASELEKALDSFNDYWSYWYWESQQGRYYKVKIGK